MKHGAQRPRLCRVPSGVVSSAGQEAITLIESCKLAGRRVRLDDWQRWCVEQILSEDATGRLAAWLILLIVPRQNGKNLVLAAVELAHLYLLGSRRIIHSAHRGDTALDHYELMKELIESNPSLNAITRCYGGNGKEQIRRTDTRARIRFITRAKQPLRGGSPQLLVLDEALVLNHAQLQAMVPSLSAQSMNPDGAPQVIYTSSAPLATSEVLHDVRNGAFFTPDANTKIDRTFAAEWGIELPAGGFDELDLADRDLWAAANPGLNVRISEEWIESQELGKLKDRAFAIERLGVVFPLDDGSPDAKIPPDAWAATEVPRPSVPIAAGEITMAWGVATDGLHASIAIGAGTIAHPYVEVIVDDDGVGWLPAALVEKIHRWNPKAIGCNGTGPSAAQVGPILDAFRKADPPISADLIEQLGSTAYANACQQLLNAANEGRLEHLAGQGPLDHAAATATDRRIGDGFGWNAVKARDPICSLEAATVAAALLPVEASAEPEPMFAYTP